jgi:c-di-GMP-binding flagellar brake protein YcgR
MENRRTRRYVLDLPLAVLRPGHAESALKGQTRNISSGGVLFTTEAAPPASDGRIEYVIALGHRAGRPLNLRCMGKIVRMERREETYRVAATLERYEFERQ